MTQSNPGDMASSEPIDLTIAICAHNPREDYLAEALSAIAAQEPLPLGRTCEFLLIDNASKAPLAGRVVLPPITSARIVREEKLGLIHARLRSFHEARGRVILYVDDDNVLRPDYLREVLAAFNADPFLALLNEHGAPWAMQDRSV